MIGPAKPKMSTTASLLTLVGSLHRSKPVPYAGLTVNEISEMGQPCLTLLQQFHVQS